MNEDKFRLPESVPENYRSVLNFRNAEQERRDRENPPEKEPPLYGFCGTDCRECEYFISEKVIRGEASVGCRGCRAEGGDCDIRVCCLSKNKKSCGSCDVFPCDMLKKISEEQDSENLFRMKEEQDRKKDLSDRFKLSYSLGLTVGITAGAFLSAATGLFPQLLICGLVLGITVPAIVNSGNKF